MHPKKIKPADATVISAKICTTLTLCTTECGVAVLLMSTGMATGLSSVKEVFKEIFKCKYTLKEQFERAQQTIN